MANTNHNDLFSSLISDIKSYSGNDPLLPWLSGVRKMKDCLPQHLLKEKLPRFLQKCAQTFDSNRHYRNDLRYIRIWLQLMDYVDDPMALLRTMEMKKIGLKRCLFYQAYALYYEKIKKFDEADKMYRLGVQNLAEPMNELQKSYEQFIQRVGRHKSKRLQRQERRIQKPMANQNTTYQSCTSGENKENLCKVDRSLQKPLLKEPLIKKESTHTRNILTERSQNLIPPNEAKKGDENKLHRDDSVVAKFVDSAIVGKSEAENACHHGLVEPTINTKEAMNAINSMFREPIEPAKVVKRSSRGKPKVDQSTANVLEVFTDQKPDKKEQSLQEPFKIFVDDESSNDLKPSETPTSADDSSSSSPGVNAFVFLRPEDHQSESSNEMRAEKSVKKMKTLFREDTVVGRFVGSAILDEPEVENICHHGLVEPTVNLKEAMEDINGMFGKPIDFVRTTRRKRQEKAAASGTNDFGGFAILPDDEFNNAQENIQPPRNSSNRDNHGFGGFAILPDDEFNVQEGIQPPRNSSKDNHDFHEPTVFTKEAMDDINNLFKMPLDF